MPLAAMIQTMIQAVPGSMPAAVDSLLTLCAHGRNRQR